jgi:hypothetical protein
VDFPEVELACRRRVLRALRVSFSMIGAGLLWAASVQAGYSPTNHPFSGIAVYSETRTNPPNRLFVAEVDLGQPGLEVRAARGGPDPDGPGPWQTTLLQPTRIAARERFDLVVNGDFFKVRSAADGETNGPGYRPAVWSRVNGPAASQCEGWATNTAVQPSLVVRRDGHLEIRLVSEPGPMDCELIAGNTFLVKDGRVVAPANKVRHPRTAVGLNAQGTTLVILVVDGRKAGIAQGMNYAELAEEMLRLGCDDALNLDGGGSSLLAIRDPAAGNYQIVNEPTDGRERPVANVLGVVVRGESGPSVEPRGP